MRKIEIGEEVTAKFSSSPDIIGTIVGVPQEGYELFTLADKDNKVHHINYKSSSFERFVVERTL